MSSKSIAGKMTARTARRLLHLLVEGKDIPSGEKTSLYYLTRQGYVARNERGYTLTPKGSRALTEEKIWSLSIPHPKRWDGKWHIVLFDIPKDKRRRRDIFRLRIKELGFVLYQNSVWAHPYPAEDVLQDIADFYKLSQCISFITAEHLTGEEKLRTHFKLKIKS